MSRSSKKPQQDFSDYGRPNKWQIDPETHEASPQRNRRASDKLSVKPFEPRSPKQAKLMDRVRRARCVFLVGPAGTAKTFLAARKACELLAGANPKISINKVVITRPNIEAAEPLGFLPGDQDDKMAAWVRPFIDNMKKIASWPEQIQTMLDDPRKPIETLALGFMRGNGWDDGLLVLDEGQNATIEQLKMFLTRAGEGTQLVVTMDPTQCDLKDKNGKPTPELSAAKHLDIFKGLPGVDVIYLSAEDIVRSELVATLVQAFEKAGK